MGNVGRRLRLRKLEAGTTTLPARTEEEISRRACGRMTTEDLLVLEETCRRLLDSGEDWGALTQEERAAFEQAYARYEEAKRQARAAR